jgi:hypothetical protein
MKKKSIFGDKWLDERYVKVKKQMVNDMRVTTSGEDAWKDKISYYRFWANPKVREKALISCITEHCREFCEGRKVVLLISDTTDTRLDGHMGRMTETGELGPIGTGAERGFLCHPTLAVDGESGAVIGLADIYIWKRNEEKLGTNRAERDKMRWKEAFEEKESSRWPTRAELAGAVCAGAEREIAVQDREGDIYESFCQMKETGLDFVIRSTHDRNVNGGKLSEVVKGFGKKGEYELAVEGGRNRKKRIAKISVTYGSVELRKRPHITGKRYPKSVRVNVVYVEEEAETVPKGEKRIEWRLYTTLPVDSMEGALKIVKYYKLRWRIEELFRTLKKDGLNFENSELEKSTSLRKLLITALAAAVEVLQLKQARKGTTEEEASLVFSPDEIRCIKSGIPGVEGKTEKQKNPHKEGSLAWAAWFIARLGGWAGYASQRPPGVITFRNGWVQFHSFYDGWRCATTCV